MSYFQAICRSIPSLLACWTVLAFSLVTAQELRVGPGIALRYPGDKGIGDDALVVFSENFEDDWEQVIARWDTVRNPAIMTLTDEVPPGSSGRHSLLMSQRPEVGTGADLYRIIHQ